MITSGVDKKDRKLFKPIDFCVTVANRLKNVRKNF